VIGRTPTGLVVALLLVACGLIGSAEVAAVAATERAEPIATATSAPSGAAPVTGATAEQLFAAANADFAAGRYDEAIAGFRTIVARFGYSPALLFDLGNASFRAGRLGEAILWYERARLLAPGDPDVQANLRQARRAANLPLPAAERWLRFAEGASANALAMLASASLFAAAAIAVAARLGRGALEERPGLRRTLVGTVAAALVVASGAGLLCVIRLRDFERAVVLGPDAALLVAPYEAATASASLDPGEIVQIEQRHQGFALVRSASGRSGWVRESSVAEIVGDARRPADGTDPRESHRERGT
jgi:tetratricopeptide (TPR) repeat protein